MESNEKVEVAAAEPEAKAVPAEVVDDRQSLPKPPRAKRQKPKEEARQVAVVPPPLEPKDRELALYEKVLSIGDINIIERYLDARAKEELRQARLEFERHFAEMKAELPIIKKRAENKFLKSKYAPIEDMQKPCDPVITKHGFFYSWREEFTKLPDDTLVKRVTMDITGWGYTKSNWFDAPMVSAVKGNDSGKEVQNPIQVMGVLSTYGQRYTFKAGFGIVVEGEDPDGDFNFEDGVMYADEIQKLRECKTLQDLGPLFNEIWNKMKNDEYGKRVIQKVKNEMKAKLTPPRES